MHYCLCYEEMRHSKVDIIVSCFKHSILQIHLSMKTLIKICRNLFGHTTVPRDTFAVVPGNIHTLKKKKKELILILLVYFQEIFKANLSFRFMNIDR